MKQQLNRIGFIGTGVMGSSMIERLLKAGYPVVIHNRTREKAKPLIAAGARWADSPAEVAAQTELIITMVGYPADVEAVYFGPQGIIAHAQAGSILVDMTTSTPTLAQKIATEATKRGCKAVDAPVSGGDIGAKNGTLSIMVGGEESTLVQLEPIFAILGNQVVYQGEAGAGQHTKMCNQIAIASNMIGVMEAVVYAQKAGLDPERVLQSISSGAAGSWSLSNLVPRVLNEDYTPGFYIKHFIKDMKIALDEAKKMELPLPGLQLALQMYEELAARGEENAGTQALIKYWQ